MDDDNNGNNNPRPDIYRIRVSSETEEQHTHTQNVKANVKYLPLDERIPYLLIGMKSEELTPCVRAENVSTKVLCKQSTAFPCV